LHIPLAERPPLSHRFAADASTDASGAGYEWRNAEGYKLYKGTEGATQGC
jgi:hypothetical protein